MFFIWIIYDENWLLINSSFNLFKQFHFSQSCNNSNDRTFDLLCSPGWQGETQ